MVIPAARRGAAALISRGETERTARIVENVLRSERQASSEDDIARIVRFAQSHVPFYRRTGNAPFAELPVMTKATMVDAPDAVLADGARPERLASRLSSGTSGIMFRSSFDAHRIRRHRGQLVGAYRFLEADPFGSFLYCREWFQVTDRERFVHALQGHCLYSAEEDERTVREVARWLSRRRGVVVLGLCSYLEVLLGRFEQLGITIPEGAVSVVLGIGEPMTARLAEMSLRQLGTEVRMRYSNTENGLLGFTEPGSRAYKLDTSTFHVEILDMEQDVPAEPGALGRIVVTDLYNRAMPFIRYDTGDLGRFAVDAAGEIVPNVLEDLAGRVRDFPIAGTRAAPRRATHFKILEPVEQIAEIRQFQLRQHDIGRFTWIVNAEQSPAVDDRLRRILDEEIGDILECTVVRTDEPLRYGAGKRQTFVSEIPDPEAVLARGRT
ncbi:hypothetical protein [Brachybacterium phenoliresistens]|uniref:hypothetical protein n=1 Tax=Brachybacterium phenoliresistens TaxID=396014 RepID=UPI0031D1AA4E